MESLPPPKPFVPGCNPANAWKKWKKRFLNYLEAANLGRATEKRKMAILFHVVGDEGQDVADTFRYTDEEGREIPEADRTLTQVLTSFDNHYVPKTNVTFERRKFLSQEQREEQTIDDYVTELRHLASTCEYGSQADDFIKDAFVGGVRDLQVKERLLRTDRLNLTKALEIAKSAEASKKQVKSFIKEEPQINVVRQNTQQKPAQGKSVGYFRNHQRKPTQFAGKPALQGQQDNCFNCGGLHERGKCPAMGRTCRKCNKRNHYARVCRSGKDRKVGDLQMTSSTQETVNTDSLFIGSMQLNNPNPSQNISELKTSVNVEGKDIIFKLDTGAQANILSFALYKTLSSNIPLKPTKLHLHTYTKQDIPVRGSCNLRCTKNGRTRDLHFLVTCDEYEPILGLQACTRDLELVRSVFELQASVTEFSQTGTLQQKAQVLIEEFSDVFEGLGELPGEYHITLKEGAVPSVHPPRKVPFALMEKLKNELDRMQKLGIIRPVTEPTEWVHPMVIVHKPDGSLRICLDPQELNATIKRSHYKMPTMNEISSKMYGAKYFTVLDASQAFLQKKLDTASSLLCTFATPFGRFCFLRLPYGISASPEIFQQEMDSMLGQVDSAEPFLDDIIQWGHDEESYLGNLRATLEAVRKRGLKLSRKKMQLAKDTVYYLGHEFSANGIKPTEDKISAIRDMPLPENKQDLLRWLGMVGYLTRFVPHMADMLAPLRKLLHKDTLWTWNPTYTDLMDNVKTRLSEAPVLVYYDVSKPCEVVVDASSVGLGAVLMQEDKPVAYASCTLTSSQAGYAQIEKELLAVTYGCEHFHQFVYGKRFVAYTDHKPLIAMSKKPLSKLTSRLQRLFLRLHKYDVELRYRPGKDMHVSDTLSRAPNRTTEFQTPDEDVYVTVLLSTLEIDPGNIAGIREATREDQVLVSLKHYVQNGWPRYRRDLQVSLRPFWSIRDEIHLHEDLLLRGDRIIIPEKMRPDMLQRLHEGHSGIVNTLARARQTVYWPGMNTQVQELVRSCKPCSTYQAINPREPALPHKPPDLPWYKLAMDFFEFNGRKYLQIIDYYSKFVETILIPDLTAVSVIPAVKSVLARHGIPHEIITDGGPPFQSQDFSNFASAWGFKHTITSPHYPQSNGEVERSIRTVKQTLRKILQEGGDPYKALLAWRNTPMSGNLYSPAQLLMGRTLQTTLPKIQDKPCTVNHGTERRFLQENYNKQLASTSRNRQLRSLNDGDKVWIHSQRREWVPATVKNRGPTPRTYDVKTQQGVLRRNRRFIRPRVEIHEPQNPMTLPEKNTDRKDTAAEPSRQSKSGRGLRKPQWLRDYHT